MKWSILVLTQEPRAALLDRLLLVLGPQVAENFKDVELLVRTFDVNLTLGDNRQLMIDDAKGEYLNFIDDDDLVPFDYVKRILPKLDGKVDMVGFKVDIWIEGVRSKPAIHSLKYAKWSEDSEACYRNISHLNPIKTSMARLVKFEGGRGEDHRWAKQLTSLGLVKTEHFIEDFVYLYVFYYRKNVQEA